MIRLLNRTDRIGLLINALVAVLAAVIVNGVIAIRGWAFRVDALPLAQTPMLPPDWVIGTVWVVLFALMGAARWLVIRSIPRSRFILMAIIGFMTWCLAYPFVTDGLRSIPIGLLANGITVGLNVSLCVALLRKSLAAALIMGLPVAWVLFASFALLSPATQLMR